MKELDAVNMLLRLIGSTPVNSLQAPHPDVANALTTLRRVSDQLQQKGWWFNLDYNIVMTPNSEKDIKFASTIVSAKTCDTALIKRGDRLYNRAKQTYKFDAPVTLERVTRLLEWDELPETMKTYCAYFAAAEFVRDELEDQAKQDDLNSSAQRALIEVNAQELDEGNHNMFDKARVRRARYGTRPYNLGMYQ